MLHDVGRTPAEDRELAELLTRAGELARRVTDALRRGGAQRTLLTDDAGTTDPDRTSRKTRTLQAAAHLVEDLHRLVARTDAEVAWVDGTRRNVRLRLSPIDVGTCAGGDALGRGDLGADQRHHPAAHRRAGRARALPLRGAQRRQPVRLPRPRAALRRPPPARPARAGGGGGTARGAGAAAGGGRAGARSLSSPAGGPPRPRRPRWHPSSPTRSSNKAISPRAGCSRSSPGTRRRACSPRSASGRASTSPVARSRW